MLSFSSSDGCSVAIACVLLFIWFAAICTRSTSTITSKKRCGLSLKRKLDILDLAEKSNKSKRKLAEELGVLRSMLYDILKEKDKLKERRSSWTDSLRSERHRTAESTELNRRLLDRLNHFHHSIIFTFT